MTKIIPVSEAIGNIFVEGDENPITVIGTEAIRATFCEDTIRQAVNAWHSPGVHRVVLNPDAHVGYGAPIGCVMTSPSHIYPGPVGVDIKCSMSLLQLDLDAEAIEDKRVRRQLINAICERTPTGAGAGQRSVSKSRHVPLELAKKAVIEGASVDVCNALGIDPSWAEYCEDSAHFGHKEGQDELAQRLAYHLDVGTFPNFPFKMQQFGSFGGGNHFAECEIVHKEPFALQTDGHDFGLLDKKVAFLSHCGSRGFGNVLATNQFKKLQSLFKERNMPFPGGDKELVYAELGTPEANDYLDDMALGANFATVNHLLINALILEAFSEVFPNVHGNLVYMISHNIARREPLDGKEMWVHRKGATRAFPAGHPSLIGTRYENTGHPILLPGNPRDGSAVLVAEKGADVSCYSVNHGAGRAVGRRAAFRQFSQKQVNDEMFAADILTNCRNYPLDEAPNAYKDFSEVLKSVTTAGLARVIAKLEAKFVIKDGDKADD